MLRRDSEERRVEVKGAIFRIQVRDGGSLVWAKVEASHGDKWVDLRLI